MGATWHSRMDQQAWIARSHCEQVLQYAARHRLRSWIAIDDDDERWREDCRAHLVLVDDELGLADHGAEPVSNFRRGCIYSGGPAANQPSTPIPTQPRPSVRSRCAWKTRNRRPRLKLDSPHFMVRPTI
ncbi:HAD domain-containing protein [Aromatoleum toluvorans]|uniref:HAD domain-containing protein n=1 Tax=Aromatoleum toluvorans TaxID=92002 RepID=UPI003CCDB0CD